MAKTKTIATTSPAAPAQAKKTNFFGVFLIFWGVILVIGLIAVAVFKAPVMVIPTIFAVAAFSFVLMMWQLLQKWEGTVEKITQEEERRSQGDDWVSETVTYAYIRLIDGKLKKERSAGWKAGDHLKKERWEMDVKVV